MVVLDDEFSMAHLTLALMIKLSKHIAIILLKYKIILIVLLSGSLTSLSYSGKSISPGPAEKGSIYFDKSRKIPGTWVNVKKAGRYSYFSGSRNPL